MMEETLWHPVADAREVASQPLSVQLLERPLVLWRDASGAVQALACAGAALVHPAAHPLCPPL